MAPVPASVVRQAERLRIDGNSFYSKGRIGAAIDAYTEAIVLNPDVADSFVSRAKCFREKKMWGRVEEDCRRAIDLDRNSFKGHYLLGLALLEKEDLKKGIKELERALDLGRGLNIDESVKMELWQNFAKAKFKTWEGESSTRSSNLQNLKDACLKALTKCHQLDLLSSHSKGNTEEAQRTHEEQSKYLSQVFNKASEEDQKTDVPEYLCCKISLEILRDPVITPSGITYERSMILDHLRKVGKFDPVTREPLEPNQLAPNLAIKDAVTAFMDKHEWAYEIHISSPAASDEE